MAEKKVFCCARIYVPHAFNVVPCSRKATVKRGDKSYCWQHDPKQKENGQ